MGLATASILESSFEGDSILSGPLVLVQVVVLEMRWEVAAPMEEEQVVVVAAAMEEWRALLMG